MDLLIRFVVGAGFIIALATALSILVYWLSGGPKGRSDASTDSEVENPTTSPAAAGPLSARLRRVSSARQRVADLAPYRRDHVTAEERMKRHQ